jgi:hypothetical protein
MSAEWITVHEVFHLVRCPETDKIGELPPLQDPFPYAKASHGGSNPGLKNTKKIV